MPLQARFPQDTEPVMGIKVDPIADLELDLQRGALVDSRNWEIQKRKAERDSDLPPPEGGEN